jgi:hypothetical protein
VIGEPTDRKRSEAFFSDMRLNRRSSDIGVADMVRRPVAVPAKEDRRVTAESEYLRTAEKEGVRPSSVRYSGLEGAGR